MCVEVAAEVPRQHYESIPFLKLLQLRPSSHLHLVCPLSASQHLRDHPAPTPRPESAWAFLSSSTEHGLGARYGARSWGSAARRFSLCPQVTPTQRHSSSSVWVCTFQNLLVRFCVVYVSVTNDPKTEHVNTVDIRHLTFFWSRNLGGGVD